MHGANEVADPAGHRVPVRIHREWGDRVPEETREGDGHDV